VPPLEKAANSTSLSAHFSLPRRKQHYSCQNRGSYEDIAEAVKDFLP